MAAVIDHGSELIEREDRIDDVRAVAVDETAFLRASPTRSTVFATGIVDLRRGKLINIIDGRSRKVLADWLSQQPSAGSSGSRWRRWIRSAAMERPYQPGYPGTGAGCPARRPVGTGRVDDVRRRVQQQTYGHRGRCGDPLYRIRRMLRRGAEHLTDNGWARLLAGIEASDDRGQVAAAWVAAQELRAIYACRDRCDRSGLTHCPRNGPVGRSRRASLLRGLVGPHRQRGTLLRGRRGRGET